MREAFHIDGPACLQFSGGRTSAYMLRRVLDAHGGALPPDVRVAFDNTGKEDERTLVFVDRCAREWGVGVVWLEYVEGFRWREVTFATASRRGEPFAALVRDKQMLPNVRARFCTSELKIRTTHRWLREALGFETWTSVIGFRADESRRVAKRRERGSNETTEETCAFPLHAAGVTRADVLAFWRAAPFDLGLKSWEGNCDGCFLKGNDKKVRYFADHPGSADWWIALERETGGWFRPPPRLNYTALERRAAFWRTRQVHLPIVSDDAPDELSEDCGCTD